MPCLHKNISCCYSTVRQCTPVVFSREMDTSILCKGHFLLISLDASGVAIATNNNTNISRQVSVWDITFITNQISPGCHGNIIN